MVMHTHYTTFRCHCHCTAPGLWRRQPLYEVVASALFLTIHTLYTQLILRFTCNFILLYLFIYLFISFYFKQ